MTNGVNRDWDGAGALSGTAVTALAVSPAFDRDRTFFAATLSGLFCSVDAGTSWRRVGERHTHCALTSVAVSPGFVEDGELLVAGLDCGALRVTGGGTSWAAGDFQGQRVDVSALVMSPEFTRDGVAFAGTMANGVYVTRDRGATWEAGTFGLLDLDVSALAISPQFSRDETLFAATATGVFRSPNGGRAWREVGAPGEGAVVQSLAISPEFGTDGVLYAGTVQAGLFRSRDRGVTWQPTGYTMRDACVNAIVLSPRYGEDCTVLMVTESAVYVSYDAGDTWSHSRPVPAALCIAVTPSFSAGDPVLVGLADHGISRLTRGLTELITC